MSSQGPALVLVKQSQWRFLLILAEGRSTTYRAEKWCRVIFVLLTSSEHTVLRVTAALILDLDGAASHCSFKGAVPEVRELSYWGAGTSLCEVLGNLCHQSQG